MRKNIVLITVILSLSAAFFGCREVDENNVEMSRASDLTASETTVTGEITPEIPTEKNEIFSGFGNQNQETFIFGNTISCLNQGGLLYADNGKTIYSDTEGNLVCKTAESQEILLESANAKCINFLNDTVYYINSADNKSYAYSLSQKTNTAVNDDTSLLIVSENFTVYEDTSNRLYVKTDTGNELISENMVLWTDFYGDNIIFTELKNNSCVKAYNMNTKETVQLLEYGFSLSVYGNDLYYQGKDGCIYKMDLTNGKIIQVNENWGQQFCIVDDELYYLSSKGICSGSDVVYSSADDFHVELIFICNDELYFVECKDELSNIYRFDTDKKERELVQ